MQSDSSTPEEWRVIPIPTLEQYEVSNLGRIRRTVYLKPWYQGRRARVVLGRRQSKSRHFIVAVLVARAFIGPRPGKHEVNHIDGDCSNDRADNLEYLTKIENMRHAFRLGLIQAPNNTGSRNGMSKLNEDAVRTIRKLAPTVSRSILADRFGVEQRTIQGVIVRRSWRHVP